MNNQTILYINSKDFTNTANLYNGIYNLPLGVQNCSHYYIKNFVCSYTQYTTIYNNYSSQNPYFQINQNGGPTYLISIPPGNYSADQITTLINNQLNAYFGNGVIDLSYNSNNYLFSFNTTVATTFNINFRNNNSLNVFQSIGLVLGFPNVITGLGLSFTSIQSAQLAGPLNYFILSSALVIGDCVSFFQNQQSNCVLQIPINTAPGGYIIYENQISEWVPLRRKQLQSIDLQIVDDYNNPVNLANLNFSLTIVISNRNNI